MRTTRDLMNQATADFCSQLQRYIDEDSRALPWHIDGEVSPIEMVMGMSLWNCVCLYNFVAALKYQPATAKFFEVQNEDITELRTRKDLPILSVWYQVKISKYHADFVVRYSKQGKTAWVAIECDGHDYHDRTKEQAAKERARDRYFQTQDIAIFRFTGSEIWRDPTGPATEAITFAQEKVLGS